MPFSKPSRLRPHALGTAPCPKTSSHASFGRRGRAIPAAALLSLAAIAFAGADAANAADGVLEINQTCAEQTGCFPGDTPGFPVSINAPGSYRLTSSLVVPDANTTAISVPETGVKIDLGGFAIIRADCVGLFNTACPILSGFGRGITTFGHRDIHVSDGSIIGMGNEGVDLELHSTVERVRVRSSGAAGIRVSTGGSVRDCTVSDNGDRGIVAGSGSTVSGNTVFANASDGIFASSGSSVLENAVYDNDGDGIVVGAGSAVMRNTIRLNSSLGLRMAADSGYRENIISDNTGGTVTGGVNLFSNLCDGSTSCP